MRLRTTTSLAAALVLTFASAAPARATTKEECLDAHGRGQDLRERGLLVRAKQTLMTCAQSACPPIVQADCSRMVEELGHIVPTVTFAARDSAAADLPATTVFVDDVLFTTRLDDGRAYELDPGRHAVRYVHEGKETVLRVVVNQGEKGRVLLGTFVEAGAPPPPPHDEPPPEVPTPHRPILPLVVAGMGASALVAGGILWGVGLGRVPSNCSTSTHECAAPPGDPSFDQARSGVSTANTGIAMAIGGALVLGAGLVWYFVQPSRSPTAALLTF
ncbi:MAG TPA: hypothetical protein VIF62_17170 [Labilithrix sp.]